MLRCLRIVYSPAEGRIHIGKCYGDYDMVIRNLIGVKLSKENIISDVGKTTAIILMVVKLSNMNVRL